MLHKLFNRSSPPPDACLVHGGMNDASRASVESFTSDFTDVCAWAKVSIPLFCGSPLIVFSSLIQTQDAALNIKVATANAVLRSLCESMGWVYCSNDTIMQHNLHDTVHLGVSGVAKLHRRVIYVLRQQLGLRSGVPVFI